MKIPIHPKHPERVCWGCERLCPAGDLVCGEDKVRAMHPVETFWPDAHTPADPGEVAGRTHGMSR